MTSLKILSGELARVAQDLEADRPNEAERVWAVVRQLDHRIYGAADGGVHAIAPGVDEVSG